MNVSEATIDFTAVELQPRETTRRKDGRKAREQTADEERDFPRNLLICQFQKKTKKQNERAARVMSGKFSFDRVNSSFYLNPQSTHKKNKKQKQTQKQMMIQNFGFELLFSVDEI